MTAIILDRVSAALMHHALEAGGRQVDELPAAVADAAGGRVNHSTLRLTTNRECTINGWKRIGMEADDGSPLAIPPVAFTLRRDVDEDLVMSVRELRFSEDALLYRTAANGQVSILLRHTLPHSTHLGIINHPLREIVSHPVLDRMDLRIRHPSNERGLELATDPSIRSGTRLELWPFGKTIIAIDPIRQARRHAMRAVRAPGERP